MIPVTLTPRIRSRRASARSTSSVVNDQLFTPLMTYAAILEHARLVRAAERHGDAIACGARRGEEARADRLRQPVRRRTAVHRRRRYMVAPLASLIGNDYEKVDLEGLDLTIGSSEEPKTATLQRVWLDDPRPRAGPHGAAESGAAHASAARKSLRTLPIGDPGQRQRHAVDLVTDGTRLAQAEQREARPPQPRSVTQMIRDAQQGPPQQHALRQAARVGCRRGGQRRDAVLAAAVGAGGARGGSQRRQFQSAAATRRSANGNCRPSMPSAGRGPLTDSPSRRN